MESRWVRTRTWPGVGEGVGTSITSKRPGATSTAVLTGVPAKSKISWGGSLLRDWHHEADRVLDQPLDLAQELGPGHPVVHAVIDRQRQPHHLADPELAVDHDR